MPPGQLRLPDRDLGYESHGLTPPAAPFRFELTAPSGEPWTIGREDAQTISGPAHDFCLLVTRRRHRDDLALTAAGEDAEQWLDIAQTYRGPAGEGRKPGQFVPVEDWAAASTRWIGPSPGSSAGLVRRGNVTATGPAVPVFCCFAP